MRCAVCDKIISVQPSTLLFLPSRKWYSFCLYHLLLVLRKRGKVPIDQWIEDQKVSDNDCYTTK